jgi:hypothetical protein
LNTIWITRVESWQFDSVQAFTDEYCKQVALVSNLTHFYFKEALTLLDGKNVATFCYIQEETAHKILNSLSGWPHVYRQKLLPLLREHNLKHQFVMDLSYDPADLHINPLYLDLLSGEVQLVHTIDKIRELALECTIHGKIELLRQIRATFLREIELTRAEIASRQPS